MTITHRHRCAQWRDVLIDPRSNWLWGTCLAHYGAQPDALDPRCRKDQWTMLDEQSETLSFWNRPDCPFCGVTLQTLLDSAAQPI